MDFGKLEKVDLRTVWQNEATHFTPWLAQDTHLQLLGDTIGLNLQLEGTEQSVGPFSADILCKVEDRWVLIENQLERTDHTHLGQLLTYSAGLDAVTIIWIAARFTEEHRAALDWLNEITGEDIHFFGLEIECWRIDDSRVAPKFNLVSKPNNWTKAARQASREQLTPLNEIQVRYWTQLNAYLEEHSTRIRPRRPWPRHYIYYAVGRSGCDLRVTRNSRKQTLQVGLVIRTKTTTSDFELLVQQSEHFHAALGYPLTWDNQPNHKQCWIGLEWTQIDPNEESDWPRQIAQLGKALDDLHRVFSDRLQAL